MPSTHDGIALLHAAWRKSSYSNGQGGDCLEVAGETGDFVPVRDSKRPTYAPLIAHTSAWAAFVSSVKSGHVGW